jgi:hypothetical protein
MPRLHGRNSTATNFHLLRYAIARSTVSAGLMRDKRFLDRRLRFALPRVDRLSEGPAAEDAHRVRTQ